MRVATCFLTANLLGVIAQAGEATDDPLVAFQTLQFATVFRSTEVTEAIESLKRASATNSLVCVEIGRRFAGWAGPIESGDLAIAAFGRDDGFCRNRFGDVLVALSSTGDEKNLYGLLRRDDFVKHKVAIERVLSRATAVSLAELAQAAAHYHVMEFLPAIAKKVSKTDDADDPIVFYVSADRGMRWSISVARDLLALGAEEHLELPEVRAALQRCLDIEGPRRPAEGTWWAGEEAKVREPIMQRVRAALASTATPAAPARE